MIVLTVAVDVPPDQAIAVKEQIAMDLEQYGKVQIVRVDEPEQMHIGG